ncbi:MAG: DUF222 domain-containing protein, partial [Acidimicrobiales bacterium]
PDSPDSPDSPDAGSSRADVAEAADSGTIDSGTIDSGTIDSDVGPKHLIDQAPRATIIVRVDLEALRRGTVQRGELCEIAGQGPVPVEVVRHLLDDSYLNMVFSEAGDIKAVSHQGRTINQRLRTALAIRDRHCVVPGCGVAYWLEIDHIISMERGGLTCLDNLALLCHHHHWQKTYEGWQLARTGPTDEDPGWTFTPLHPFDEQPPEPVPRR